MKRALLLSASSYKDSGYLNHCKGWIKEFLGGLWEDEILFIPFAGVRRTNEQYEQKVADCLESNNIRSIHRFSDMKAAVKNAKSICIGGGNTFVLLNELYKFAPFFCSSLYLLRKILSLARRKAPPSL